MAHAFPPVCLSIGASDSSGGAGVQADLKTFTALSCFSASVVTAVTAQSFAGLTDIHPVPEHNVRAQLEAAAASLPIRTVKVGLCPTAAVIRVIARFLREHPSLPVVVDPVIASAKGIPIAQPEVLKAICDELLPRAILATPNRFEAATLAGMEECLDVADMAAAAKALNKRYGCSVVVTGGGLLAESMDVYAAMDGISHFGGRTIPRGKVRGAGCAYAAAITAHLAKGDGVRESIMAAKVYVSAAIEAAPSLPDGNAVIWHGVTVKEEVLTGKFKALDG